MRTVVYLCYVDEIDGVILSHFPNKTKAIDFKFQVSSFKLQQLEQPLFS